MRYEFRFDLVLSHLDTLLYGATLTVRLSVLAMALGLAIAIPAAVALISGPRWLRLMVRSYVEVVRNTPFLVQIFLIFFGLPSVGIVLSPTSSALVAMVFNVAAYCTELIRAGIESVPRGQIEAGRALGLTGRQVMTSVVLRPALRNVYPSLTSQYVLLMLQSSIVSTISAEELTALANDIASTTFASFETYIIMTGIYFVMGIAFSGLFALMSRRLFAWPAR